MPWDVFICYASEDKESLVRPLADELRRRGLSVWYDELSLTVGDSLRRSIDRGLAQSQFGIVVLSTHFFKKEWPQKEVDGLVTRETGGVKVILPVWHNIGKEEVARYSPMLADRVAVSTSKGLEYVVTELFRAIQQSKKGKSDTPEVQNSAHLEASFHVGNEANLIGTIEDIEATVDEALYRIEQGYDPPFTIEIAAVDNVSREFAEISQKVSPSPEDRRERIHLKKELDRLLDARDRVKRGVLYILCEQSLKPYTSSSRRITRCIMGYFWLFSREAHTPFNPWKLGFTGYDLYRFRSPKLSTTIWLNQEEDALVSKLDPTGITFQMEARWTVLELPDDVLLYKAIPQIVCEVIKAKDRQIENPHGDNLLDLSKWYFGLH
ncbi:MAG: toll/interleukin-1 receptor domain-containing protein [Methanocellales archaeon]|nr:toll/interleukin-1 receptor domain-containing protein [Methanocellales archaeon]MDD3291543.1 toll/interleukin-1 receptor domain-containing protein [Methanocellales archaeon]MDD5235933.1 toll/interleukin-1 receptor domain-containing protein [Methanocellales archaeon]MDD5485325.1 toll/interleukin-1 receptor domain-containing protein [Methanocellales archaeon]